MSERVWRAHAADVLSRHGFRTSGLAFVGAGEQNVCFGTPEVVVLFQRDAGSGTDLTGHMLPGGESSYNSYAALRWLTGRAADAGVGTPRILATDADPHPYALMLRARGTIAATHPEADRYAAGWFGQLGAEIRTTNLVETTGFGMLVPDGSAGWRGGFASWADFLERWLGAYLCVGEFAPDDTWVLDLFLAQGIVSEQHLSLLAAKVRQAQQWPVASVLTHYDNRLANLVVDGDEIAVLDWGLSLAGIGIRQELIKLFESGPMSMANPRVAAFLRGYGLSGAESADAIEDGKLMLALDGIAMSHGWATDPDRLDGIRLWLQTVKRIVTGW